MPRTKTNYSNTIIYRIFCKDDTIINDYIGSTTNFIERKTCHKSRCYNENNTHNHLIIYKTIRDNGGWENWTMLEIEKFPCQDKNEARLREQYWIDFYKTKLNEVRAFRTQEQKKEQEQEAKKKYAENNKEKISECRKIYNKKNKEYISKYKSEYREKTKSIRTQKYTCECGGNYTHQHKTTHEQTKLHKTYIENIKNL
jgi:hypothetical protein